MRTRTDIDPDNTWVVSDTHFHDEKNRHYHLRPDDVDQLMIAEWRAAVPADGVVLHLGDVNYSNNARFKHLLSKELPGRKKYLIRGNHDRQNDGFYKKAGFFPIAPFQMGYGEVICTQCWGSGERSVFRQSLGPGDDPEMEQCSTCEGSGEKHLYTASFSHYPWNDAEEGGAIPPRHYRFHGHIHNNGYTRNGYVPFLKNHVNLSVEQTKYKPVNLKLLLDAVLLGKYDPTTDDQLDEVRKRREENYARKEASQP